MQHSARSVPLGPDSSGGNRALPRQDRTAVPRRSRHTAETGSVVEEEAPVVVQLPTHSRRARREQPDSIFSLEEPPPLDAPAGITEITGWELAAAMWRDHLPEQLLGIECTSCKQPWPCDTWKIADDLLTECCEAARQAGAGAR